MLTLNWKSHSYKNAISSIYEESFTPDYYYNSAKYTMENAVSKISWLIYASVQYSLFVRQFGTKDDILSLEQIDSLVRILVGFCNDDKHAKTGKYYSIYKSVDSHIRLYVSQIGYEALLPFAY